MIQTIQQNIKELNITMSFLNQRITKIKKQVEIKIPIQTNISFNDENSGNKNQTTHLNNYKCNQLMEEIIITRIQMYGVNQLTFIIKIQMSIDI